MKILLFSSLLILNYTCFSQGIFDSVRQRNINEILNDTFYYKKNDTIYKVVYYPETKEHKTLISYYVINKTWISSYNTSSIREEGYFTKQNYGIRFIFRKKKYKRYFKTGEWKYYDKGGNVIRTEKFNRSR